MAEKDINEIIDDMASIDNEKETAVPLFKDVKVVTPFKDDSSSFESFGNTVPSDDENTFIGKSTKLDSNVTCGGNIEILGSVNGNVVCAGKAVLKGVMEGNAEANDIIVVEGGKVTGDVNCKNSIDIHGDINGNITAKSANVTGKVEGNIVLANEIKIAGTATITGDITTASISIENGAVMNGRISIKK